MNSPATTPPAFSGYQKFVIAVLALLQFTVILDFMVISPLGDIMMKTLDMPPARFALAVSAYAFAAGASGIMAAGFADKYDRKKLLLFFYSGFILGTAACALAPSFPLLLAGRIVTGLFGGVIGSVSLAVVTDLFSQHQRGRVMGFIQMAFAASQVLGIPIGLYLANLWGWHSPFWMIAGLGVVIFIAIYLRLQPVDKHLALQTRQNPFAHLWSTVSSKRYQTGFVAIAFLAVGGFMLMPFGSAYLINNIHITQAQLPVIYLCSGLASIIIMPVIGKLSDKMDKVILFAIGSSIAIIAVLVYTHIPPIPLWQVVIINIVMFMGIMSRMIPATAINTSVPEMKDRGAYMSITSSMQQVAGGLAAVLAGMIVYQPAKGLPLQHYGSLGWIVSGVMVVCVFLVWRIGQMVKQSPAAGASKPTVPEAMTMEA